MRRISTFLLALVAGFFTQAQNVGIGTTTPTEKFHVVGPRVLFETNYTGIGVGDPATGFTSFQVNKNVNTYVGMYINSGATGLPFYGYALNGVARAYTMFNSATNQLEYHQSSDATPDFYVNGNTKTVFNTGFVGINTSTGPTAFTGFAMKSNVNTYYGSYIDAGATGIPFYGYALNGTAVAYSAFNGGTSKFEYHRNSDAVADFQIGTSDAAFPNTSFLGIGTVTPTTAFTGFAMKKNIDNFFGSYIDAGALGKPFYGYALNGVATAYTSFNASTNKFEYHRTSDAVADFQIGISDAAFPNTSFLGIGTVTPTTAFTGFTMKKNINDFFGSYIDAGATGKPFYGYALNGVATAYTSFNASTNKFEYHRTSDAVADFQIGISDAAFPNTNFLGIGTTVPTTAFTGLAIKSAVNDFYGAYVDAGSTGKPFYGYALNGVSTAYTSFNSTTNRFEYHHLSDAVADFQIGNTDASFPAITFLGVGASTATNANTGLTLKRNVNDWYGIYVDAGVTGRPFYGYALNGTPQAWTELNGTNGNWELNYGGARFSVSSTGFVGINAPPTSSFRLDVGGTIRCTVLTQTSDERFKKDIQPLSSSLEKIESLNGVSWQWKTEEFPNEQFNDDKQIGFIAQEVEKVIPEVVATDSKGYKSIDYSKITAVLTEALKEQQKQVKSLKNENEELKKKYELLLKRIEALESIK